MTATAFMRGAYKEADHPRSWPLAPVLLMPPVAIEALPMKKRKEIEEFLSKHPLSPAGRLRPRIGFKGTTWYALLGPNVQEGKVGFGPTPVTALRAFNRNFGRTASSDDAEQA
jgi:hypothetical protein